jgi:NTE family protein
MYVDGGLRMNVPLSPALRLGAQRVIVVSLRHNPTAAERVRTPPEEVERVHVSAPFLIGKTLDALMLDRTDQDLDRVRRYNEMLESGMVAYGPKYSEIFNSALLHRRGQPIRYVRNILVRPSKDIGELAAAYAASPEFKRRAQGLAARAITRLASDERGAGADLISYVLFDGGFSDLLIDLGRRDARAQEEEWARFWSDSPQSVAEGFSEELLSRKLGS